MALPGKRKSSSAAKHQPPPKRMVLRSTTRDQVAVTEALVNETLPIERTAGFVSQVRNANPLSTAGTTKDNVTQITQIENGFAREMDDIYTRILNVEDSLYMFEQYILTSHDNMWSWNYSDAPDFGKNIAVRKEFLRGIIENIDIDLNKTIAAKVESFLKESFISKYDIDRLMRHNDKSDEDEEVSAFIQAEVRGIAGNVSSAAINDAKQSVKYQAAAAKFKAALSDIMLAQRSSRLVKAVLRKPPHYLKEPNARDTRRVTELASLVRKNVAQSAPMKRAAQKMIALMNCDEVSERLEKWSRDFRDSLVCESQGSSGVEPKAGRIVDTFHKMRVAFVDWIRKKRLGLTENMQTISTT